MGCEEVILNWPVGRELYSFLGVGEGGRVVHTGRLRDSGGSHMVKPTVASVNSEVIALRQEVVTLASTVASLEAMLKANPITPPAGAVAEARAQLKPLKAQRDGLQHPTCINHRKCGNRCIEGVPIRQHTPEAPGAIGWKCEPCSAAS